MDNQWDASAKIESAIREITQRINLGIRSRAYRASNELRNASQEVLRGQRSGRRYKVPGTYRRQRDKTDGKMKNGRYYTASAPGEAPAVRTGNFRQSWQTKTEVKMSGEGTTVIASIESSIRTDNGKYLLGEVLEEGTSRMAPRPYKEKIQQKALPRITRIYREPYL